MRAASCLKERLLYGFHPVFALVALLDPKLYPVIKEMHLDDRVEAGKFLLTFFESKTSGDMALT